MRRTISTLTAIVAVAGVWLLVLPWIGKQAVVKQHVDALHAADINASAMFYSELECQQWLQK